MAFEDYSTNPSANTTLGDGTYVGPNMLRNKVRPALQQIMADGKALSNKFDERLLLTKGDKGDKGVPGSGNLIGFSVDDYCAGDGMTNDTLGFQELAAAVTAIGGGVIDFTPGATYVVGLQTLVNNGSVMFQPQDILTFGDLPKGIIIRGNGAKLKLAPGLRFGTFNPSGVATAHTMPYTTPGERAVPVNEGVINIQNCTGPITIENLEMDGNVENLTIGGQWGDTGWQLAGDGLALFRNSGGLRIINVHAHHCPRDGFQVSSLGGTEAVGLYPNKFEGCTSLYNGRQGLSLIGGKGFKFENCRFSKTGKNSVVSSAPGSGVDLEAEHGPIRNVMFELCEFDDNAANGMVADSGDTCDVEFAHCRFIGTTGPSAWSNKPRMRYRNCTFVGSLTTGHGGGLQQGVEFDRCRFTDRASYSPSGVVAAGGFLADMGGAAGGGQYFRRCIFDAANSAAISVSGATFEDCSFHSDAAGASSQCGSCTWKGATTVTGLRGINLNIAFATVFQGTFTVAGVDMLGKVVAMTPGTVPANGVFIQNVAMTGTFAQNLLYDCIYGDQLNGCVASASYIGGGVVRITITNPTTAGIAINASSMWFKGRSPL